MEMFIVLGVVFSILVEAYRRVGTLDMPKTFIFVTDCTTVLVYAYFTGQLVTANAGTIATAIVTVFVSAVGFYETVIKTINNR